MHVGIYFFTHFVITWLLFFIFIYKLLGMFLILKSWRHSTLLPIIQVPCKLLFLTLEKVSYYNRKIANINNNAYYFQISTVYNIFLIFDVSVAYTYMI